MATLGQAVALRLTDARVQVASPDGGCYLLPQFGEYREALAQRDVTTGSELCERLLEDTGVALLRWSGG